ncbi:MAG: fatty acid desaturase, partial [Leptospiraceae bacterium]|nr:fatty acid desaturase [Leptospiraceae bacterium]
WPVYLLGAFIFIQVQVTVYSLMHEACHRLAHRNALVNYVIGLLLGMLFFIPFTFFEHVHNEHHRLNRTDHEMFDLYYPGESRWKKALWLYIILIGFYWLSLPVLTIVFAFWPGLARWTVFRRSTSLQPKVDSLFTEKMRYIRAESALILLFHFMLLYALQVPWQAYVIYHLALAVSWSSQNYVNHAFAPRDILRGAHNHKLGFLTGYLYLNYNCHRVHHTQPALSWKYLSHFVDESEPGRISYYAAWLRIWGGPRETHQGPPRPLAEH